MNSRNFSIASFVSAICAALVCAIYFDGFPPVSPQRELSQVISYLQAVFYLLVVLFVGMCSWNNHQAVDELERMKPESIGDFVLYDFGYKVLERLIASIQVAAQFALIALAVLMPPEGNFATVTLLGSIGACVLFGAADMVKAVYPARRVFARQRIAAVF